MKIFDYIVYGYEVKDDLELLDYVNGIDWMEVTETESPKPKHSRYEFSANGVGVYYDHKYDYYYFTDEVTA